MKVTLEISMYPLKDQYGYDVISFIKKLKSQPGIRIRTNSMSTQITGQFEVVWEAVKVAFIQSFRDNGEFATVLKVINTELDLEWQTI
jgi:uncharacterized protein YqgV (UPF0045/DUF77 family)